MCVCQGDYIHFHWLPEPISGLGPSLHMQRLYCCILVHVQKKTVLQLLCHRTEIKIRVVTENLTKIISRQISKLVWTKLWNHFASIMKESVSIVSSCDPAGCYMGLQNWHMKSIPAWLRSRGSVCLQCFPIRKEALNSWKWRWLTSPVISLLLSQSVDEAKTLPILQSLFYPFASE